MALHACLENKTVVLITEVEDEEKYKELSGVFSSVISIEDELVRPNVGWTLEGISWAEGELTASSIKSVTPRQMRVALVMSGISIESIDSMIAALDEPTKSITKITWEYSTMFERDNPVLNAMAPLLGLTPTQVDDLFTLAATL
jgi:hypothetical protein